MIRTLRFLSVLIITNNYYFGFFWKRFSQFFLVILCKIIFSKKTNRDLRQSGSQVQMTSKNFICIEFTGWILHQIHRNTRGGMNIYQNAMNAVMYIILLHIWIVQSKGYICTTCPWNTGELVPSPLLTTARINWRWWRHRYNISWSVTFLHFEVSQKKWPFWVKYPLHFFIFTLAFRTIYSPSFLLRWVLFNLLFVQITRP